MSSIQKLPRVLVKWCGRSISYERGLRIQKKYLNAHLENNSQHSSTTKNVLLLLEHSPVYTIGIRTRDYSSDDERRLRASGADFQRSDRGGLITFHGPGQLVAYPIFDLEHFRGVGGESGPRGIRWYVCQLERTLIRLCEEHYGLSATAPGPPLTGVWVGGRKIAAIGIHATRRSVVSHGLALNCDTDLTWFERIVPCGLQGKEVTSLTKELAKDTRKDSKEKTTVGVMEAIDPFLKSFADQFRCEMEFDEEDLKSLAEDGGMVREIFS